jgi:hypothetical protein
MIVTAFQTIPVLRSSEHSYVAPTKASLHVELPSLLPEPLHHRAMDVINRIYRHFALS